ncbi:hypothetical protein BX070DRAFT_54334 [Coemansia spiralis]|nr:hypothetical protein BX070DRAFT_54334 [Coemansia spiralis]
MAGRVSTLLTIPASSVAVSAAGSSAHSPLTLNLYRYCAPGTRSTVAVCLPPSLVIAIGDQCLDASPKVPRSSTELSCVAYSKVWLIVVIVKRFGILVL